ncbi:MAG: hypothetical protein N2440_02945 [Actinobacteria bacterium]|nr:hypothetical protein [Actinomycetota bacterium]
MNLRRTFILIFAFLSLLTVFSGCERIQEVLKRNDKVEEVNVKRESFLKIYEDFSKEIKKKDPDALFTGAIMMKPANEPWDGKSSVWSAGFYSQKNNKAYILIWDKGNIRIDKETNPDPGIKNRVVKGTISVDSSDALEIARATMITQIDNTKAESFKSLFLAYSNSLKKHVWAVSFEGNHRILIDAITGEVLEAK